MRDESKYKWTDMCDCFLIKNRKKSNKLNKMCKI